MLEKRKNRLHERVWKFGNWARVVPESNLKVRVRPRLLNRGDHIFDGLALRYRLLRLGQELLDPHAHPKFASRSAFRLPITLRHTFLELGRRHLIFAVLVSPLFVV